MNKLLATATLILPTCLWSALAQAHEGHGKPGLHWHDADVGGLALVAAVAAATWWLARKK